MLVPPADMVARAKATIKECSVSDVNGCLSGDTIVIDIREPGEYERGHLPGAVLLPRGLLEFEIHNLVARYSEGQPGNAEDHLDKMPAHAYRQDEAAVGDFARRRICLGG